MVLFLVIISIELEVWKQIIFIFAILMTCLSYAGKRKDGQKGEQT